MTYDEMAAALGVTRCRGRLPSGHYCDQKHEEEGSITYEDSTIHFSERRVRRPDTHAFLRLVARVQDPSLDQDVPWRRVYRLNVAERRLASALHITNPNNQASEDRAFVLASVAGLRNDVPMRKKAFDWARRRGQNNA